MMMLTQAQDYTACGLQRQRWLAEQIEEAVSLMFHLKTLVIFNNTTAGFRLLVYVSLTQN